MAEASFCRKDALTNHYRIQVGVYSHVLLLRNNKLAPFENLYRYNLTYANILLHFFYNMQFTFNNVLIFPWIYFEATRQTTMTKKIV